MKTAEKKHQGMTSEEYLGDLDALAYVSGVPSQVLRQMRDGIVAPNKHIKERLSKFLSSDDLATLCRHETPRIETETYRRGTLPTGTRLLHGVATENLRPGDMIAVVSTQQTGPQRWVSILSCERIERNVAFKVVVPGGTLRLSKNSVFRVARPLTESPAPILSGEDDSSTFTK